MASIAQPFRLTALPKIASLNNFSTQTDYLQVANTLTPSANKINIGVSGSSISQYIINPTPKLVYNLSIPSTSIVTACDVSEIQQNEGDTETQEVWCYALVANKSFTLNTIIKPLTADAPSVNSTQTFENYKVSIKHKVASVKVFPSRKTIIAVLQNGLVQTFDFQLKLLHSADISYGNISLVKYFTNEVLQDFMIVLTDLNDDKVCYKLFEIIHHDSNVPLKELNSIILEGFSLQNSKTFYQFGKIYTLSNGKISIYSLPHFQLSNTINLPFVTHENVVSFKPISTNRALLTVDNRIYLLDLLHNAILSQRELTHVKTFQLLTTAIISGNTAENNKTIAIGVSTKFDNNATSALDIVNINVGSGTLKDSMSKGFLTQDATEEVLNPLFDEQDDELDEDGTSQFDYNQILSELEKAKSKTEKFDNVFFKSLNIKKEYYTEYDRFFNSQGFLDKILSLIFENFNKEYPRALTYLLTHPLFPAKHATCLLSKFKEHPRLFKQAIVTCPNLPLDALLHELFTVINDELCLDLSLRILQDFTKDSIKQSIKKMSKVDINNFIGFVINEDEDEERNKSKPQLFQLLNLVLDSIGLFALDGESLENLHQFIENQVDIVEQNIELLNLLDDTSAKSTSTISSYSASSSTTEQALPSYSVEYL